MSARYLCQIKESNLSDASKVRRTSGSPCLTSKGRDRVRVKLGFGTRQRENEPVCQVLVSNQGEQLIRRQQSVAD